MKMKLITLGILVLSASATFAQLQVRQNGHVIIGDKTISSQSARIVSGTPFTPDTTLTMTITGSGSYNTGGVIGFGSNGEVSIGELKNRDNVLRLFAKRGLIYNSGETTDVFRYTKSLVAGASTQFEFFTKVSAPVFVTDSDVRLKTDIKQMGGLWKRLQDLTPVSYILHDKSSLISDEEQYASATKEVKATELENTRRSYGLVAQEVREVFPELVYENEEGVLGLDYQGFIPILIEAVNNLSQTVAEQRQLISEQQAALMKIQGKQISLQSLNAIASMNQNRPNPFSVLTEIKCLVPQEAAHAVLNLYDLRGKQLKSFPIEQTGEVSVSVSADGLEDGMYLYALIVDGVEVESRRMIISR